MESLNLHLFSGLLDPNWYSTLVCSYLPNSYTERKRRLTWGSWKGTQCDLNRFLGLRWSWFCGFHYRIGFVTFLHESILNVTRRPMCTETFTKTLISVPECDSHIRFRGVSTGEPCPSPVSDLYDWRRWLRLGFWCTGKLSCVPMNKRCVHTTPNLS